MQTEDDRIIDLGTGTLVGTPQTVDRLRHWLEEWRAAKRRANAAYNAVDTALPPEERRKQRNAAKRLRRERRR